jgi:hypothetical protein
MEMIADDLEFPTSSKELCNGKNDVNHGKLIKSHDIMCKAAIFW